MNIDFNKLLQLLLPTFVRTSSVGAMLQAIASYIQGLYIVFLDWQTDMRLQAAMTCQVMYLETILNYRLLGSFVRTIYITDGDGVNVDFIVNVPGTVTVDNYRMIALIEKYKIAGKRYTIGQSMYSYNVQWTDFQDEKVMQGFVVYWTGWVDELTYVPDPIDNLVAIQVKLNGTIQALTPQNVTSLLAVTVNCIFTDTTSRQLTLHIQSGNNQSASINPNPNVDGYVLKTIASCVLVSVSPEFDSIYQYYRPYSPA